MHLVIDNRLSAYRAGGIPQYTTQLAAALAQLVTHEDRLTLIEHRKATQQPTRDGRPVRRWRVWTPPHHRWEQLTLPLELTGLAADVIHFPDFVPLFRLRAPAVITVHDLAFVRYPDILDDAARRYYGQIQRAVSHAAAIIAVSHSTRRDILALLEVDESKIAVIPEAAAPHFQPIDVTHEPERVINGQRLRAETFALFVGTVEPRKNLTTLLHALRTILDRGAADRPQLVIAGPRGWLDAPIFKLVDELRLGDAVRFIGGVTPRDLVWLYSACRVYLHPELYSGFGLPILEAMQCGAPVIAADTSSLPEVAGSAGWLIPPRDVAAWSDAWQCIWRDESLRTHMREAGFKQAARFSWTAAAAATWAVYRSVAQRRAHV